MDTNEKKKGKFTEKYRVFLTTHKGLVRDNNEDNFTINNVSKKLEYKNVSFVSEHDEPVLAAVFDGMGGESKGEYASFISAKIAKRALITRSAIFWSKTGAAREAAP